MSTKEIKVTDEKKAEPQQKRRRVQLTKDYFYKEPERQRLTDSEIFWIVIAGSIFIMAVLTYLKFS